MAAPPPQSQPPALMDELLQENLLRLPSDNPAQLVRAALVCKRWCRLVTDPGFRRRFRLFHRAPPMLGLIVRRRSPATTSRFLPTSSFYPYDAGCRTRSPLNARHGRILFYYKPTRSNPTRNELNVWTPATGVVRDENGRKRSENLSTVFYFFI
ncbi:uncharacterized protein [Miscanthus floridulus]|uniref:uncharacterized protein n=1 Tax=Miscanthus floridulus TaxID=154761 RepID=UPI00345B1B62